MAKIWASYISIWDGNTEIRTNCSIDLETKLVSDIQSVDDVYDLEILEKEYVELPDGTEILNFTTEDGYIYVDGQRQDD